MRVFFASLLVLVVCIPTVSAQDIITKPVVKEDKAVVKDNKQKKKVNPVTKHQPHGGWGNGYWKGNELHNGNYDRWRVDSEREYTVKVVNGKYQGQGTLYYYAGSHVGEKYVGNFNDGYRDGDGTATYPSGDKYVGQWRNDKIEGKGTFTWSSGDKYVGQIKDDEMEGQGTYTWTNGNKYVGQFKNGKREGQGTYTWTNGNKYVGQFKNDKREGQGTLYSANGTILDSGQWKDDVFIYQFSVGQLWYTTIKSNEVAVSTGKDSKPSGTIVVPESVENNGRSYKVTSIGGDAFYDCHSLRIVTIPNSVTSIGIRAFHQCYRLTSVTIPNSVTSIYGNPFVFCSALETISVASGNTKYDSRNNCNAIIEKTSNTLISGCKKTVIPNSVTGIGGSAFSNCFGLTSITIPNSVTSIGEWAFFDCNSLKNVTIPNSVTSIGNSAFRSCYDLTSVSIPSTLIKKIPIGVFRDCNKLTSITVRYTDGTEKKMSVSEVCTDK